MRRGSVRSGDGGRGAPTGRTERGLGWTDGGRAGPLSGREALRLGSKWA